MIAMARKVVPFFIEQNFREPHGFYSLAISLDKRDAGRRFQWAAVELSLAISRRILHEFLFSFRGCALRCRAPCELGSMTLATH